MANSPGSIANNETLTLDLELTDADTGLGYDMSAATEITFAIHDHQTHTNVITVTTADGVDDTDAATGILLITVSADSMGALDAREYTWEVHVEFADSESTPVQGTIEVLEGYV